MTPWPCTTCGADGVRNLGTEGFCALHLARLYVRFDPGAFALRGVGLPGRTADPLDLTCAACGAGWVGTLPGEPCPWCVSSLGRMQEWAAESALEPPDVNPNDARYPQAMRGWAERLDVAVAAGLVNRSLAERAILRKKNRAA